ncbi:MAG: transporter substrate-binding domain-containing protein [Colwellia sp.]
MFKYYYALLKVLPILIICVHTKALAVNDDLITPVELTQAEQRWIVKNPVVIVGSVNRAPLEFLNEQGEHRGIVSDLLQLVTQRTGLKFKVKFTELNVILADLKVQRIDIAANLYKTEVRQQYMTFTKPYLDLLHYFFIKANIRTDDITGMNGLTVAIPKGYETINWLNENFPKIKVLEVDSIEDAIDAVLEGRAELLFDAFSILDYALKKDEINTIVPFKSSRLMGYNPIHFATNKNAPYLAKILEKGLLSITAAEEKAIHQRWFGSNRQEIFNAITLSEKEVNWLQEHNNFRYSGDPDRLPYEGFDTDGQYVGIIPDILKILEKKLGITFDIIPSESWSASVDKIKNHEIDILTEGSESILKDQLDFTQSYFSSPVVLITRSSMAFIANIEQVADKKIALIKNYAYSHQIMARHPNIDFQLVDTLKEGLIDVSTGKTDIFIATLASTSYYISKLGISNIHIAGYTDIQTKVVSLGVRKEYAPLIPLLNKALSSISPENKRHLVGKWTRNEFAVNHNYLLIIRITVVLLLIIAVFIYFNYKKSNKINRIERAEKETRKAQGKLAEQIKMQQILIDTIPIPVFYKDTKGRYLGFNHAFLEVYDIDASRYLGLTALDFDFLPMKDRVRQHENALAIIKNQNSIKIEATTAYADGKVHDILFWGRGYRDSQNNPAGMVSSFVDISSEKENARQLEIAVKAADAANQAKADFLANMSHEIRTPMNAILGLSELALNSGLNKKQHNYINKVHLSALSLLGIINDILDISKIEAGKMDLEYTDFMLADIFDNLANLFSLKFANKNLEFLFDITPEVPINLIGDPLRLGQILTNLVNNALKFTEQGEIIISVTVQTLAVDKVLLCFNVLDTGIGISASQQESLFQSFSQADTSTSRKYGGTGLGLSIAKNLTELMGGEINVKSVVGKGSSFRFTAWFKLADKTTLIEDKKAKLVDNLRILVVDDNGSARDILAKILTSFKLKVETTKDGKQALEAAINAHQNKQAYDIILMDWHMPIMDGIESTKKIREALQEAAPKFILSSSFDLEYIEEYANNNLFDCILTKPVTASAILDALYHTQGIVVTRSRIKKHKKGLTLARNKLRQAKILLVEDNDINQELAVEILKANGMVVAVANNGQIALDMLANDSFDGILMDCQMPIMDGYTATKLIRKKAKYKDLPIIAMTANAMAGDKEKVLAAGMNDHIAKPIDVKKMLQTMAQWIDIKEKKEPLIDMTPSNTPKSAIDFSMLIDIDIQQGLAITQGNDVLYFKLLNKFYLSQKGFIEQYQQAEYSEDKNASERAAHTLKGVAANIGAIKVQKAASELEMASKQQLDKSMIALQLLAVSNELASVIDGLAAFFAQNKEKTINNQQEETLDIEKVQRLRVLIAENDGEAVDLITDLVASKYGNIYGKILVSLESSMADYDFDAALDLVDELLAAIDVESR